MATHKALIKDVARLVAGIVSGKLESSSDQRSEIFISWLGRGVGLTGLEVGAYNDICDRFVAANDLKGRVSKGAARRVANRMIVEAVHASSPDFVSLCRTALAELASQVDDFEVVTPLRGILLECDEVKCGEITVLPNNDQGLQRIHASLEASVSTRRSSEEASDLRSRLSNQLSTSKASAFAVFKCSADPAMAIDLARSRLEEVFDVLRYAVPFVQPHERHVGFGIAGEPLDGRSLTVAFASRGSARVENALAGRYRPLVLSPDTRNGLSEQGVFDLLDIGAGSTRSDLEEGLLLAARWCGRGQAQGDMQFRIVCVITAVESLFASRQYQGARRAAESIAALLGQSLDDKRHLRDRVVEIYGLRNRVLHQGGAIVRDSEFERVYEIAGKLIVTLLRRRAEFPTRDALWSWLSDRRLGE